MHRIFDLKTRGAWGYRDNGIDFIHYIDDASYPERLGLQIVRMISEEKETETVIPEECFSHFLEDSIFCEHAYIIDLDTSSLEYYQGMNTDPDAPGRYAARKKWEPPHPMRGIAYYGTRLVKTIPFELIRATPPDEWLSLFRG
jgi:hypothetical protein